MELTIDSTKLEEVLYGMEKLVSEGLIKLTEENLRITTADPAMVALVDLTIPEDSFEEYNPEIEKHEDFKQSEDEEAIYIGVNFENMSSVSKYFDDEVTITVDENDIILKEGSNTFSLPILNLSTDDIPEIDNLEFKSEAEIDVETFSELVDKASVASDSAKFEFNGDSGLLTVKAEGKQITADSTYDLEEPELLDEEGGSFAESRFALEYLKKFERFFSKLDDCDSLKFKTGDDFPARFEHSSRSETLNLVLAPRIEEA